MKQNQPARLGALAADLARVVSASGIPAVVAVRDLLEESRAFIEWGTPTLLPDRVADAARLVEIGRGITKWYWIWPQSQDNTAERQKLAAQAQAWSDEILQMSGLLESE
ncbi:MAG: hypothetical protein HY782_04790 [Chloroflexi bacterium]|nr:hypothetical protein [Chloroflexota bacterium]